MGIVFHCWPKAWLEAVVESGLATRIDGVVTVIGGDDMRDKLEKFATLICEIYGD